jgi:hypothetical protein
MALSIWGLFVSMSLTAPHVASQGEFPVSACLIGELAGFFCPPGSLLLRRFQRDGFWGGDPRLPWFRTSIVRSAPLLAKHVAESGQGIGIQSGFMKGFVRG